jgi:hypothetical protein
MGLLLPSTHRFCSRFASHAVPAKGDCILNGLERFFYSRWAIKEPVLYLRRPESLSGPTAQAVL